MTPKNLEVNNYFPNNIVLPYEHAHSQSERNQMQ